MDSKQRKCRLDTNKKNQLSESKGNDRLKRLQKKRPLFSTTGSFFLNVYKIFISKGL